MVVTQKSFQEYIPGFQFNIGYCGKFFLKGSAEEADGDRAFVKHAEEFRWFGHNFAHLQPHLISTSALRKEMISNKKFAEVRTLCVMCECARYQKYVSPCLSFQNDNIAQQVRKG